MRNQWAKRTYDEVNIATSLEEVEKIFNGNKYLTKNEFGAIIGEMIGNFSDDMYNKLLIAFKSKKYNEHIDALTELEEPFIVCLFKAFFNNVKNGNTRNKNNLKNLIFDKSIKYNWFEKDKDNNTILHILMENCNLLNDKEFDEVFSLIPLDGFNILNKNDNNETIIQLFKTNNRLKTANKKKKIIEILNESTDSQAISIDIDVYIEAE